MKQDILPDRYTYEWFNATKTGTFHFTCAEFCGTDHSIMAGPLVIMTPEDYARWTAAQPEGDDLAHQGKALFQSLGCSGCHTPGSSVHAPDLRGVYGHVVHLSDGSVRTADEAYLRDCMLLPDTTRVAGFPPIMPNFTGSVDEGQIVELGRLHQIADHGSGRRSAEPIAGRPAMTDVTLPFVPPLDAGGESYLDEGHTILSWLTTTDHKRIAILYALSITVFFFIGGVAIGLVRLELISPTGLFLTSDEYNRLFTIHGIIMVWFFLVPSIPATMGNFMLPMMIGAPDVAFPRLNLMSWYLYVGGGLSPSMSLFSGGVDTGWTFYPPFSSIIRTRT